MQISRINGKAISALPALAVLQHHYQIIWEIVARWHPKLGSTVEAIHRTRAKRLVHGYIDF